ncbi:MAG: bifunctional phosphoribosyl-AMP cyclohydrolase/phosphoribosyl-ATP diphosphatase HisIE [Bacteroidia bacterium]|nr:bifunctional phosphoribosyl-AMP cyclohydrolase/phosphoribosyl-ATP diphosphatase HisIE [Bacteroidia bacterium]
MRTHELDFAKTGGLIPAIVQDSTTARVLMLGYMNPEALEITRATGKVTFFSRTKNRLWTKGETSGHFLHVTDILHDCDGDTLLIKARPAGPVCHTGADTCFEEPNSLTGLAFLPRLGEVIHERRSQPAGSSYTASLFQKGLNKIAQKVGEEAVEVVIEAKDDDRDKFVNECADLLFHLMVLLEAKGESLDSIARVLAARHKPV